MSRALLAVAAIASAAGTQQAPVIMVAPGAASHPFRGGPLDGLGYGDVVTPTGRHFRGLLPSRRDASPISESDRPAVAAFIDGHTDGSTKPLKPYLARGVTFTGCKQQNAPCAATGTSVRFGEPCTANTPYRMANGIIRIEWLYGSALFYVSNLTMKNGKIVAVQTAPAWAPVPPG